MTTAPPDSAAPGRVPPPVLHGAISSSRFTAAQRFGAAPLDRLPRPQRQRRPGLAVAGALLVGLCGVASAGLAAAGHNRIAVLALAHDVRAGQVLTAADLRVAHLSGDNVSAVSADGRAALIGQTLTATLPAGTLLNASMLTPVPLPAAGLQLVAVAVKPGGVPVEATPGRDVALVRVATGTAAVVAGGPSILVAKARVVSVQTEPSTGSVVLSVQVPAAAAAAVAQASAAGTVAVTLLPVAP